MTRNWLNVNEFDQAFDNRESIIGQLDIRKMTRQSNIKV